jgi:hypothetical protein
MKMALGRFSACVFVLIAACDARVTESAVAVPAARAPRTMAEPLGRAPRRALLVGINDYSASTLAHGPLRGAVDGREFHSLGGAVRDVETMRELLVRRFGFAASDIVTLTDQEATRAAILDKLQKHLVEGTGPGDILFFFFAGHGSQVRNTQSDERDKLDESLVPADAPLGIPDIRDKELRRVLNAMLDRGGFPTVVLDSCHSASGGRGGIPSGAIPRGVKADLRDVADGSAEGPWPEHRGALVIAATQDFELAWEVKDDEGHVRGALAWALACAMRDAIPGEPAVDTFLRTQARVRAARPDQDPVLAGDAAARLRPFLGVDRQRSARSPSVIAVEKVAGDGAVILQGGWVNGLTIGTELRLASDPGTRLQVTSMIGLGRSEARVTPSSQRTRASTRVASGTLLEVVSWAAPPSRPLRVWIPTMPSGGAPFARRLEHEAQKRQVHWIADPTEARLTHLLRPRNTAWELLMPDNVTKLFPPETTAEEVMEAIPARASLFVQLPVPTSIATALEVGPGTEADGIEPVIDPGDADYLLVARLAPGTAPDRGVEVAWVRPYALGTDGRRSGMPARSQWQPAEDKAATPVLSDAVLRLRRVHGWHVLESPPAEHPAYGLAIRREPDGKRVENAVLVGHHEYGLTLRELPHREAGAVAPRYAYAFLVDSWGKGVLLFPTSGSVENRFPLNPAAAPPEIVLDALFEAAAPYGVDTFYLLLTDEPLPNPWVLEWDGVRSRKSEVSTPLAELVEMTGAATRSGERKRTSPHWSLERIYVESVSAP